VDGRWRALPAKVLIDGPSVAAVVRNPSAFRQRWKTLDAGGQIFSCGQVEASAPVVRRCERGTALGESAGAHDCSPWTPAANCCRRFHQRLQRAAAKIRLDVVVRDAIDAAS